MASRAFTVNILRFRNFRQRMGRAYDREASAIRRTADSFKQQAEYHFELLRRKPASIADVYNQSSAKILAENALSWGSMFERQLVTMPDDAALGREMAFVYLMAILDGFVARWRKDMDLDPEEGKAEAAYPAVIRDTCRELGIDCTFPRRLRPDPWGDAGASQRAGTSGRDSGRGIL